MLFVVFLYKNFLGIFINYLIALCVTAFKSYNISQQQQLINTEIKINYDFNDNDFTNYLNKIVSSNDDNIISLLYYLAKKSRHHILISVQYILTNINKCCVYKFLEFINEKAKNENVIVEVNVDAYVNWSAAVIDYSKEFPNIIFNYIGNTHSYNNVIEFHRKLFIFDGISIISGINFCNNYIHDKSFFLDTMYITDSKNINEEIYNIFMYDKKLSKNILFYKKDKISKYYINHLTNIVCSTPYKKNIYKYLYEKFKNAKKTIVINTYAFFYIQKYFKLFKQLAEDGVKITIITSYFLGKKMNTRFINDIYFSYFLENIKGLEIYVPADNCINHGKYLLIDDVDLYYGSFNFTYKSMYRAYELSIHITDINNINDIKQIINKNLSIFTKVERKSRFYDCLGYILGYIINNSF